MPKRSNPTQTDLNTQPTNKRSFICKCSNINNTHIIPAILVNIVSINLKIIGYKDIGLTLLQTRLIFQGKYPPLFLLSLCYYFIHRYLSQCWYTMKTSPVTFSLNECRCRKHMPKLSPQHKIVNYQYCICLI